MSRSELKKKIGEESGNGKLFNDIEAISKALYLDKPKPRSSIPTISSRSKAVVKSPLPESKSTKLKESDEDPKEKKSIWSWKGLKALAHVRNKRFNCCFSLQVHSVEGLPPSFNDLSLSVIWKRRDGELMIRPSRVFQGVAEFDEELSYTCSVYGSRSGPHHSAKYEAKHFLLYAFVVSMPELDLGKHRVDLTRLLPLTLEELEEEKSSGKWTTSYRLSGKAKGASMNVSFGYSVVGNSPPGPIRQTSTSSVKSDRFERASITRTGSLPTRSRASSRSVEDIKDLHEVLPVSSSELSASVDVLYQKFDEEKANAGYEPEPNVIIPSPPETVKHDVCSPDAGKANVESDFSVVGHGIEPSTKEEVKSDETALKACDGSEEVAVEEPKLDSLVKEPRTQTDEVVISESNVEEEDLRNNESVTKEQLKSEETTPKACDGSEEVADEEDQKLDSLLKEFGSQTDTGVISECNVGDGKSFNKDSLLKELESALSSASYLMNEGSDSQEEFDNLNQEKNLDVESDFEGGRKGNKESDMPGLASISSSDLEKEVSESLCKENESPERFEEFKSDYKWHQKGKSLSMDYASDSVASDFLNMLGIDHSPFGLSSESEPDSPRERLLRQFEKDSLANGGGFLNFDVGEEEADFGCDAPSGWGPVSEDCDLSSVIQASEEMLKLETQEVRGKTRASLLEDMETEALMREWGMNEKAFQHSRSNSPRGFGSPIDISHEEPQLPPLGEGLGPFVQTSNGGFLRSMNPELFRNAKSGGNLIMQVSSPVVVPAEMGSGIMDILQGLASVGIEKLSMQANKLMPLEDITGKTMQQIAWESAPALEAPERKVLSQESLDSGEITYGGQTRVKGKSSGGRSSKYDATSIPYQKDSEFVSLEDLAPMAMDKIEALSIEGLRIQSGMSAEEAPSNISPQSIGDISALEGKRVNFGGSLGLEGAGGLQLLDIKDDGDDVDGMMGLSLTLDEWMRLDSGEIDNEDGISERTSKILAAHHASDLMRARKGERKRGKGSRRGGLLGNNFTVALMVQLRDPMRNFEPVGSPMLALIQVERVFVPPKPKIYGTVSELWKYIEDEDEPQPIKKEETNEEEQKVHEEETVAQFKITEVHVAGLKTEPTKKKLWGSSSQQQSGSRWLLANGMGKKNNKHPLMKSKAATKSSSSADSLWSISSKQKGPAKGSQPVRNPNVIVPNETMKLLSGAGFL